MRLGGGVRDRHRISYQRFAIADEWRDLYRSLGGRRYRETGLLVFRDDAVNPGLDDACASTIEV